MNGKRPFDTHIIYMKTNTFLSSIFANIFAELVTGVVISLISTIKSITLYRTVCLIEWLTSLQKDLLEYIEMYQKMILKIRVILLTRKYFIITFMIHYVVEII